MDAFVVRIWRPGSGEASRDLRGTAIHLASGRDVTFTETETLIRFLADDAAANGTAPPAGTPVAGDQLRDKTHHTKGGQG